MDLKGSGKREKEKKEEKEENDEELRCRSRLQIRHARVNRSLCC